MNVADNYSLSDCELETLTRAAMHRGLQVDEDRRQYSATELANYGLVREGYNRREMIAAGVTSTVVSSFDPIAEQAEHLMPLDTPFGSGIRKWQLPIDMMPIRVAQTVFPPNAIVTPHVHPEGEDGNPGGGLRIVTKGAVFFNDREYGPGDWFFVPNGVPYTFTTSTTSETVVMYTYAFFAVAKGNRFSHPHE